MSAVSQSYPNYLGGLNEQPDELKKPGQLVEALNVIPDPVIGLTRRPGFALLNNLPLAEANGTWFEIELSNSGSPNYIYFGCVKQNGQVVIFNQDGTPQTVVYTKDNSSVTPHKEYIYKDDLLTVNDENGNLIDKHETTGFIENSYFRNQPDAPLKYCVSKEHIIFTNPEVIPTLAKAEEPSVGDQKKYYSFLNLKVVDTANYNYIFKRFYGSDQEEKYSKISSISIDSIEDLGDGWDKDLTLPLNNEKYRFNLTPNDDSVDESIKEDAVVEILFQGYSQTFKSKDGDGYPVRARYKYTVQIISPGKGFKKGRMRVVLDKDDVTPDNEDLNDLKITLKIDEVTQVLSTKYDDVVPDDISNKNSAEEILTELAEKFDDLGIDKVVKVGNGLYLENNIEFSISTSEIAVADVLNSQKLEDDIVPIVRANSVAELPVECYAGFVVEIGNSFDDQNNYFLKYNSESESGDKKADGDLYVETKADGFWQEIAKPYEQHNPNNGTLPHMITIVYEDEETNPTFIVSPIQYSHRTAGTSLDNPSMFVDSATITEVNYYKNRLFFLTNTGTVNTSRAGEVENLFLNTAISVSLIDPLDIICNSNQRVPIHGSSVVNNAIVLFGDTEQYTLSTNDSLLTTETASVTKISNYTFNHVSNPIFLGTNIAFITSGLTRLFEMTNIYDRGPVDVNERSQQIQYQFGKGYNMPVSSREQSMVLVYKKYDLGDSPTLVEKQQHKGMYMYRFRQESSQESTQTAWVKWELNKPIVYVSLPENKLFTIVGDENGCSLYTMNSSVADGLPVEGLALPPKYLDGYSDTEAGEKFETRITFPTIYARGKESTDITANLTIHRVKLSTAAIGTYDLEIERKGYDPYKLLIEQTPADEYKANYPPLYGEKIEVVPVYTRNKNLKLTMSSDYDAPLTLLSMTWEGDWNQPYYKSV